MEISKLRRFDKVKLPKCPFVGKFKTTNQNGAVLLEIRGFLTLTKTAQFW
jgi:hypothetical protein